MLFFFFLELLLDRNFLFYEWLDSLEWWQHHLLMWRQHFGQLVAVALFSHLKSLKTKQKITSKLNNLIWPYCHDLYTVWVERNGVRLNRIWNIGNPFVVCYKNLKYKYFWNFFFKLYTFWIGEFEKSSFFAK